LAETGGSLRKRVEVPVQLTFAPGYSVSPLPSKDGKRLFFEAGIVRSEVVRYDSRSGLFSPLFSGISAECVTYSRDRQTIAYVAYPEGTLWRSKPDGSDRVQLTFSPAQVVLPRWSPDGKQIAFTESTKGAPDKIYTILAEGGNPKELPIGDRLPQHRPSWSPDGRRIVFDVADHTNSIRVHDLMTHVTFELPGLMA